MTELALSSSLEDYLEAIFHIVGQKGAARPKDIATRLGVGNSSVTGALKALAAKNLVNYAPYDIVTLTHEGQNLAEDVVYRHESLREFFIRVLAADDKLADEAACRMEHAVPAEMLERFIKFLEFIEICPRGGPKLLEGFRIHLEAGCSADCKDSCPVSGEKDPQALSVFSQSATLTLNELEAGQRATVVRVHGQGRLRRRLVDLGLTRGTTITMERAAPLGDPIELLVKGTHLSVRRSEAEVIEVQLVME